MIGETSKARIQRMTKLRDSANDISMTPMASTNSSLDCRLSREIIGKAGMNGSCGKRLLAD